MKKGFLWILFFAFLLIPLVCAIECGENNIGTFDIGDNVTLRQTCDTCTYVTLSSIISPTGIIYFNENMTKDGVDYTYLIGVGVSGEYSYSVFGDKDGEIRSENFCFNVSPYNSDSLLGINLSSSIVIVVFVLFFLVACLCLFIFKLPLLAGGIFVVLGFLLLFSGFNIILSVILICAGVVAFFVK